MSSRKKPAAAILAILCLPLTLGTSCPMTGGMAGGGTSPLVGVWTVTQTIQQITGPPISPLICPGIARLEFKADGSGVFGNALLCNTDTVVQYSADGSQLRVDTGTALGTVTYGYSIAGNKLTLTTGTGGAVTLTKS